MGRRGYKVDDSFAEWEELRFDVDNGITLCKECHDKHNKKGTYNHTR